MGCALSIQGSRLVGVLLLPSRQVSRSALCATFRPTHQLDSPAGRGLGRATLTRSVSLQAPPWGRFRKQACDWCVLGVED